MEHCGNCKGCGGCERALLLTEPELALLRQFAQTPFLPVARRQDSEEPVYLEDADPKQSAYTLACLEKKGLIDIDYHLPLSGFDYSAYEGLALKGSMALTNRGQEVLDTVEMHGVVED